MHRALKIILATLVVLIVIMTLVFVVLWNRWEPSDETTNTNTSTNQNTNISSNVNTQTNTNTTTNTNSSTNTSNTNTAFDLNTGIDLTASPELLSKTFAERYGSFSTDADFANIEGLYPYMTDAFRKEQEQEVRKQRDGDAAEQYGVTTYVITTTTNSRNDAFTKYTHSTRRTETRFNEGLNTYNQDIVIELQYVKGAWYVSNATWVE